MYIGKTKQRVGPKLLVLLLSLDNISLCLTGYVIRGLNCLFSKRLLIKKNDVNTKFKSVDQLLGFTSHNRHIIFNSQNQRVKDVSSAICNVLSTLVSD